MKIFAIVGLTLAVWGATAGAEAPTSSQGEDYLLPDETEMISAPSRKEQRITESPSTVTVLTREMIKLMGMRDLTEVLRYVAGNSIAGTVLRPTGLVHHDTKNLRVMILIDGQPINDIYLGSFYASYFFKLENIKRIEIIHSPASPLYGANALGGIINIVTLLDTDRQDIEFWLKANSGPMYEVGVRPTLQFGSLQGTMSFSYLHDDGYNDIEKNNDFQHTDFFTKWQIINKGLALMAGSSYLNHGLPLGQTWNPEWDRAGMQLKFFDVMYNPPGLGTGDLSFRAGLTIKDTQHLTYLGLPSVREDSVTSRFQEKRYLFEGLYSTALTSWNTTTLGGEVIIDTTEVLDEATQYQHSLVGGFIQNESRLAADVALNVNARHDRTDDFGTFFVPGISLIYHLSAISYVKMGWSKGYRLPSDFERDLEIEFLVFKVSGNNRLKPERGTTYEVGFFQRLLAYDLITTCNFYYSEIKDYIITTYNAKEEKQEYTFENRDRVKLYGWECELQRRIRIPQIPGTLYGFVNYTFQLADTITNEAPVESCYPLIDPLNTQRDYLFYYPRNIINAGLILKPTHRCHFFGGWRWVDSQKAPENARKPLISRLKSYWVCDVNGAYWLSKRICLEAGISNLFDESYYDLVDIPGPGRKFQVSIRYQWNDK